MGISQSLGTPNSRAVVVSTPTKRTSNLEEQPSIEIELPGRAEGPPQSEVLGLQMLKKQLTNTHKSVRCPVAI